MNSNAKRISIVASTFNEFLVDSMIESSIKTLKEHGYDEALIDINRVPGAFEIPLMAKKIALSGDYKAIVALGAIVRGATPHFDFIAAETTSGLMKVGLDNTIPIGFGILTCDTMEQAIERSGTGAGNKGHEAALAAVEMIKAMIES
jgi:6,7-dimethyl-8-ribityllumazine synthase